MSSDSEKYFRFSFDEYTVNIKGASFYRNCGAASVGVLQDNLVLSTELTM